MLVEDQTKQKFVRNIGTSHFTGMQEMHKNAFNTVGDAFYEAITQVWVQPGQQTFIKDTPILYHMKSFPFELIPDLILETCPK